MAAQDPKKYHQAAVTYAVYGLIYLSGAAYIDAVGLSERGGVLLFVIGGAFILLFPPLIWKGFKWFTRVVVVLLGVRIIGLLRVIAADEGTMVPLPWGGAMPQTYGAVAFLLVAAVAAVMLARAAWDRSLGSNASQQPAP